MAAFSQPEPKLPPTSNDEFTKNYVAFYGLNEIPSNETIQNAKQSQRMQKVHAMQQNQGSVYKPIPQEMKQDAAFLKNL
eukprot:CAMPEP_0170554288 /NCGR_PEP_ID=MMETSP0211-20121228/12148_1 /TAXON_ID=311385 /ORGANISM="Pseudokeronopsis sp., Strain OXSARD2" /LENGTH=78 /DNA_ID=CAMNT_0010863237 /DNA_START=892 /DNA_END=1128 /DNA_ORIENTATION=-